MRPTKEVLQEDLDQGPADKGAAEVAAWTELQFATWVDERGLLVDEGPDGAALRQFFADDALYRATLSRYRAPHPREGEQRA